MCNSKEFNELNSRNFTDWLSGFNHIYKGEYFLSFWLW